MDYSGLTSTEAKELLRTNGRNEIGRKKKSTFRKLISRMVSPVSLMLLAAAILSYINGSTADAGIIVVLFFSNFLITIWHEGKADRSLEKLRQELAFKVPVFRDGAWISLDTALIVPGDLIDLRIGSIVSADATIVDETNFSANESVLTGESLPKAKSVGETVFSGSFVSTGKAKAKVTATGSRTSFGKTIDLVDDQPRKSALEKDILSVSKFVSIVSVIVVIFLTIILIVHGISWGTVATLDVSLLIAGIPVALPTVMSLIISIGVVELARKAVIVRRLASLEDLANVNLLLSDKTGTLTENKIYVEGVVSFGGRTEAEVIRLARSTFDGSEGSPFDEAITIRARELGIEPYEEIASIPGDSERKRSTAIIRMKEGIERSITLGAVQAVQPLCLMDQGAREEFEKTVREGEEKGYRAQVLAVAKGREEKDMEIAGVIFLADKVRSDAKDTIGFLEQNGVGVKMVTGDSLTIARRVASGLDIKGDVFERSLLDGDQIKLKADFTSAGGFAQVLPKDKYDIVSLARREHYTVAVTGDGINDLPAVKSADVGFAVSNAVDALKSTADIVLTAPGIAVIKDAIIEARKIFVRLYNYSVYRISESFRLIITIAVIGFLYNTYPLTPVEIIILAFLNDLPIISLAFDRVSTPQTPAHIDPKERFTLSTLFGLAGVANSLILLWVMVSFFHLPWSEIQTMFFLKLTVSGHMLIYVAHTKERWYKFLPSKQVIWATALTQLIATAFAFFGIFVAPISWPLIVIVWVWSFGWMQISELMKVYSR